MTGQVGGSLGAAGHLELGQDAGHVVLDGLLGQVELLSHLLVGLPTATRVRIRSSWGESRASFSSFMRCLPLRRRSSTDLVTAGSSRLCPFPTARMARISSPLRTCFST